MLLLLGGAAQTNETHSFVIARSVVNACVRALHDHRSFAVVMLTMLHTLARGADLMLLLILYFKRVLLYPSWPLLMQNSKSVDCAPSIMFIAHEVHLVSTYWRQSWTAS